MTPLFAIIETHLALAMTCAALAVALFFLVLRPRRGSCERVLLVGSGRLARGLVAELERRPARFRLAGLIPEHPMGRSGPCPVLGTLDELGSVVQAIRPDRIVVAIDDRRGRLPMAPLLQARAAGVQVQEGAELYEALTRSLPIEALPPSRLVFADGFHRRPVAAATARLLSLAGAVAALIVSAPLLLVIAALIRLDTKGHVFFAQERIGLDARRFRLYKFRTMRADGAGASQWVLDNHERITRVGRVLRRFHLDELPQFWNVLRGHMNLVGPRPHPLVNVDLFQTSIPYYALRNTVRPGITGWAQIRYGYANNLQEETEKMYYDLYYIKHRSLRLDLAILARTAAALLTGSSTESRAALRAAAPRTNATPAISRAHRVA